MSSFAAALKAEIIRLAKKQSKQDIAPLKKSVAAHRSTIASLKRDVAELKKALARAQRSAPARIPAATAAAPAGRFIAKGMAAHRKRLGLSAAEYAQLVGVSAQTIYNWERKKAKPAASQLPALAAVRQLGKREATARLAQ